MPSTLADRSNREESSYRPGTHLLARLQDVLEDRDVAHQPELVAPRFRLIQPADGDVKTACTARIALPVSVTDNPWARHGDAWTP